MLSFSQIHFKRIGYHFQVFIVAKKICIAGINKNGFDIVLFDITGIGFLDIEQVFIRNGLLIRAVSFPDIRLQFVYGCMQVDQYIRKS